jgi:sugar phosphate isomerase/epimerase
VIQCRIAVQTVCLKQSISEALHTAAQLGCEGVQFDASQEIRPADMSETGLRHLRKMLDDLNLRVASIALPSQQDYSQPKGLQERVDRALNAMRMASQLNARVLVFNLGSVPTPTRDLDRSIASGSQASGAGAIEGVQALEFEEEQLDSCDGEWSTLVDVLHSLASQGNRLGVQLAAYAPTTDPKILKRLIGALPEGALGVDLSPAPLVAYQGSAIDFINVLGPHVVHVYGNDAIRDLKSGQGMEVELGRGATDYPELMGRLEEFGYRGWMTLVRQHTNRQLEDLDNAVRYLKEL